MQIRIILAFASERGLAYLLRNTGVERKRYEMVDGNHGILQKISCSQNPGVNLGLVHYYDISGRSFGKRFIV
ncbi:hypothetical protein D3C85_1734240 [compost metagenome]